MHSVTISLIDVTGCALYCIVALDGPFRYLAVNSELANIVVLLCALAPEDKEWVPY